MGYFESILETAAQLGREVDKPLAEARAYLSRADELNRHLEAARAAEEKEYAATVESVVKTGKLPNPNGFGTWSYDSPTSRLVVASVAQCHVRAASAARAAGAKLFAALQAKVQAIVDESVRLAGSLPDFVNDERSAVASGDGGKHFATWVRLGELVTIWEEAHELNRLLQRAGWLPGPGHARDPRLGARPFEAYERPSPLVVIPRGPRERHLAAAVAAGAGPGLIDWPTAVSRWERVDRRRREWRSFSSRQSMDAMGQVTTLETGPEEPQESVPVPIGSQPIVPAV